VFLPGETIAPMQGRATFRTTFTGKELILRRRLSHLSVFGRAASLMRRMGWEEYGAAREGKDNARREAPGVGSCFSIVAMRT